MLPTSLVFSLLVAITASAPDNPTPQDPHPRQVSVDVEQSGDCSGYALNRGTWAELGIDNYLLHYPGGQNLTLFDYTRSLNVLNFDCGIGRMCLAGQLCHPVPGRDWVVLSAVQEWNFYMNSVYDAIATAMSMVQGTSASMVADFLAEGHEKKDLLMLTLGLVALSGVILLSFTAALIVPILWRLLCATWSALAYTTSAIGSGIAEAWAFLTTSGASAAAAGAAEESAVAASTAATAGARVGAEAAEAAALKEQEATLITGTATKGGLQKRSPKHHHKTITGDKFQMWSALNANLQQFGDRLQSIVAVTAKLTLYSPISSKDGLYGSLQNGTFLSDHPPKATLVDNARDTVQLGVLAQLFRVMNVIFVIDTDPCQQEGPTTPLKNPTAVHFCSSTGVKTSLGMITPKKIDYEIRNGRLLFSKYSYSTEFLYQLAAECETQRENLALPASNGTLTMANHGSDFLQNQANNPANLTSVDIPNYQNNLTQSSLPTSSNSSTILLPDGSSICSFPIPICDLRNSEIKSRISAGDSPAKACQDFLKLPDVSF